MIDPTTADETAEIDVQTAEHTAEKTDAAYEAKAAAFLQDYETDLSWEEERAQYFDDDGDLDLSDNDLPSYLLVLEDFHDEFVYQVKAAEHLEDYDKDQAMKVWSDLVRDHIAPGNTKITKTTAIVNLNSAADCPNRQTARCQVAWSQCYAHNAEDLRTRKRDDGRYVGPLVSRRRQEFLRDCLDAETYARAFIRMNERKEKYGGNPFDTLRVSEAGDFRSDADIEWVNQVAKILKEEQGITTYTYSASSDLNWDLAEHFTVNASNDFTDYGDARFKAEDPAEFDVSEGERWCPNDLQKALGTPADEAVKCGECRLCVEKNGIDVVIPIHADGVDKIDPEDVKRGAQSAPAPADD